MPDKFAQPIEFVGSGNNKANVRGNFSPEKVTFYDDFLGDTIEAAWAPSADHGGTEAITAASGGTATLTTGATDDDRSILAHGLNWYCAKNPVVEIRVKIARITLAGCFVGFSDAITEADDQIPFEVNGATIVDRATDGVGFAFDTDATTDVWYMVNTKNGTQAGTSLGTAPVASTYETFRVTLDTDGNATFYRNGVAVGYKALAVTTTVALTPIIAVINRAGAALVGTVDYVKCWQDR